MNFRVIAALSGCLTLTGCFEMEQEFVFNPDKTAVATIRLIMHASLRSLLDERSGKDICPENKAQDAGITLTVTPSSREADSVCTYRIAGDIDKVAKALSELEFGLSADQHSFISLSSHDDSYSLEVTLPDARSILGIGDKPLAEVFPPYVLSDMAQRELSWVVAAPAIGYTNGVTASKDTVATFKRPLEKAFFRDEPVRFKVNFYHKYRSKAEYLKHVENSVIYHESLECASQVTDEDTLNDIYENAKFTHKWHGDGDFEEVWKDARTNKSSEAIDMDNEHCTIFVPSSWPLPQ